MKKIINKDEFKQFKEESLENIKNGRLYIHPTDTIYGIGCNAKDSKAVFRVRELKGRPKTPFSIMVPSKEWIYENCELDAEAIKWVEKLPGPYTLILKLGNRDAVSKEVNLNSDSIGVRIPDHWFAEEVRELGLPLVTTSANKVGDNFMTSLRNLDPDIKSGVNFMIYEGEKKSRPSKIVNLYQEEVEIITR